MKTEKIEVITCCRCYYDLPECKIKGNCHAKVKITHSFPDRRIAPECYQEKAVDIFIKGTAAR